MEAGNEAHHVPVGERHAPLAAREHVADVAQLEHTGQREMKRKYAQIYTIISLLVIKSRSYQLLIFYCNTVNA